MTRSRLVPMALLALSLTACPSPPEDEPGTVDGGDMRPTDAAACKPDPEPQVDFATAPTGQRVMPGDIGTPCTANTNCKQGRTPTCWKASLFDKMGYLQTPGGYCTSPCATDADCGKDSLGNDNLCIDFGMEGKHCIASCGDAVTCRHPGYSCAFLGRAGDNILTGCWPNGNLTCNPKEPTCVFPPDRSVTGACWRQAIEDENGGVCQPTCELGDSCPKSIYDEDLRCIYIDFTDTGDAFRGTLCWPVPDMPKAPGASCEFVDECEDGYECDRNSSKKCERLCNTRGRSPRCPAGQVCSKAFPSCEAGLCKPL